MQEFMKLVNSESRYPLRGWFRIDEYELEIYARKTQRFINGDMVTTLDLASFGVDTNSRSKGNFTRFLDEIEEVADELGLTLYVESILNKRLFDFLVRRNYNSIEYLPNCLYRGPNDRTNIGSIHE